MALEISCFKTGSCTRYIPISETGHRQRKEVCSLVIWCTPRTEFVTRFCIRQNCFAVENLSIEGTRSKIKVSLHESRLWQLWERVLQTVVHVVNSHLLFILNVIMNLLRWCLLPSNVICDVWPAFLPTRRKNVYFDHHAAHVNCVAHWKTEPVDDFR